MLYGNDDVFTKSGYDAFKKALEDLKIPVTTTETFAKGDVDFKAQLTKIKASNPDAIVLSALIAEGAPIMVQARQLGIDRAVHRRQRHELGQDLRPGQGQVRQPVGRQPVVAEQPDAGEPRFVVAYTQKYKSAPDQFAAQAYDAMNIVGAGARQDQADRQPRSRPHGAARRVADGDLHRRHRPVQVPPGQRPRTASRPATTRSRPPSSA